MKKCLTKEIFLKLVDFNSRDIALIKLIKKENKLFVIFFCKDKENAKYYLEINEKLKIENLTFLNTLGIEYLVGNILIEKENEIFKNNEYELATYICDILNIENMILNIK